MICLHCREEILPDDRRDPYLQPPAHFECGFRAIHGSVGHQRGLCTCRGGPGTMEDPPGLSKREAARAAIVEYYTRDNGNRSPR